MRDRVYELFLAAPAVVREVIGDGDLFARRVAAVRNQITHGAHRAADVDELVALTAKLRLLLHAHLVRELGLSTEEVGALLRVSRITSQTRTLASPPAPTQPASPPPT